MIIKGILIFFPAAAAWFTWPIILALIFNALVVGQWENSATQVTWGFYVGVVLGFLLTFRVFNYLDARIGD